MRICGIELKSNEAIIVSIETDGVDYEYIAINTKKIKLTDSKSHEATKAFRVAFDDFLKNNNFDKIAIKERLRKGKFSGGPDSFEMEGILQTLDYPIELIHSATIKSKTKDALLKTDDINNYQLEALKVALSQR